MKKNVIIVAVVVIAAVLALLFIRKPSFAGRTAKKTATAVLGADKAKAVTPVKKKIAKGMGGLTVTLKDSKGKSQYWRIMAFKADDKNSSRLATGLTAERMQELLPGTYDLEIESIPPKLYKNVAVSEGQETVCDLGTVTGALIIKALNSKKKDAAFMTRILYPRSNFIVTMIPSNRPLEILPGTYNIEMETLPRQTKSDIKVESGKETLLDLGVVSGSLLVKALDENGKSERFTVRVKNPSDNAVIASTVTDRALELVPGEYDVEILAAPPQTKKGVKVVAGEATSVDITVQSPSVPAPKASAPAKKK